MHVWSLGGQKPIRTLLVRKEPMPKDVGSGLTSCRENGDQVPGRADFGKASSNLNLAGRLCIMTSLV